MEVPIEEARKAYLREPDEEVQMVYHGLGFPHTRQQRPPVSTFKALSPDKVFADIRRLRDNPGLRLGVPTGFAELDEITDGIPDGKFTILAAPSGVGKTSLALSVAVNAAQQGHGVAFVSQEMSESQLLWRGGSMLSNVPAMAVRNGWTWHKGQRVPLKEAHYEAFEQGIRDFIDLPIFLLGKGGVSVDTADMKEGLQRALDEELPISLVIDDYLQLHSDHGGSNGYENLTRISHSVRDMTRDLGLPVLGLCQLLTKELVNAKGEVREPELYDLKGTSAWENDADVIIFIVRDDHYHNGDPGYKRSGIAELVVKKNRDGEPGRVPVRFREHVARFVPLQAAQGAA